MWLENVTRLLRGGIEPSSDDVCRAEITARSGSHAAGAGRQETDRRGNETDHDILKLCTDDGVKSGGFYFLCLILTMYSMGGYEWVKIECYIGRIGFYESAMKFDTKCHNLKKKIIRLLKSKNLK